MPKTPLKSAKAPSSPLTISSADLSANETSDSKSDARKRFEEAPSVLTSMSKAVESWSQQTRIAHWTLEELSPAVVVATTIFLLGAVFLLDSFGYKAMISPLLYVGAIWVAGFHPRPNVLYITFLVSLLLTVLGAVIAELGTSMISTIIFNRTVTALVLLGVTILVAIRAQSKKREERLLEMVRLTPNALAIVDQNSVLIWENNRFTDLFDGTNEQSPEMRGKIRVSGRDYSRDYGKDHGRDIFKIFADAGIPQHFVEEIKNKINQRQPFVVHDVPMSAYDNQRRRQPRFYAIHLSPMKEGGGRRLLGFSIGLVDITNLRREKELTQRQLEYNSSVLNALSKPVCVVRADRTVALMNSAFARLERSSIYSRGELLDAITTHVVSKSNTTSSQFLEIPLSANEHDSVGGTYLVTQTTLAPDPNGEVQELFALQDVSQLKVTMEKLETSNQDLRQFAYVASHDLQEPLRKIASYLQILEADHGPLLNDEAKECIAFAVDGANRLRNLIRDLLTYARVANPNEQRSLVNLNQTLEDVEKDLQGPLEDSQATLISDPLPTVLGNPVALGLLLRNLITNCCKYRDPNRPLKIHVGTRVTELPWQADPAWECWVSDNGIGIDPQFQERIFGIFQRLHAQSDIPGTGLGLALCKKIVNQHGGKITVESAVNEGTTFRFTISKLARTRQTPSADDTGIFRAVRSDSKSSTFNNTNSGAAEVHQRPAASSPKAQDELTP